MTWFRAPQMTACEQALLAAVQASTQGIAMRELHAVGAGMAAQSTVYWYIKRLQAAGKIYASGKSVNTRYFPAALVEPMPTNKGLGPNSVFQLGDMHAAAAEGRPCA